jgi:hypothetical protein
MTISSFKYRYHKILHRYKSKNVIDLKLVPVRIKLKFGNFSREKKCVKIFRTESRTFLKVESGKNSYGSTTHCSFPITVPFLYTTHGFPLSVPFNLSFFSTTLILL